MDRKGPELKDRVTPPPPPLLVYAIPVSGVYILADMVNGIRAYISGFIRRRGGGTSEPQPPGDSGPLAESGWCSLVDFNGVLEAPLFVVAVLL